MTRHQRTHTASMDAGLTRAEEHLVEVQRALLELVSELPTHDPLRSVVSAAAQRALMVECRLALIAAELKLRP